MKKILFIFSLSAGLLLAGCQENETTLDEKYTITLDTYDIKFNDAQIPTGFAIKHGPMDNGENYLDFYWPNLGTVEVGKVPDDLTVNLRVKALGPGLPQGKVVFNLYQSDQSLADEYYYYQKGWPGTSYEVLKDEYSIESGSNEVLIPLKLYCDRNRFSATFPATNPITGENMDYVVAKEGYVQTFAIEAFEYNNDNTLMRKSANQFTIRVRQGF